MTLPRPLLLWLLGPGLVLALPGFEVYWESQDSYSYNDDELHNPWYIDLGAIDAGALGYIGGPNTVTIHAADYCVGRWCQENYPDEFCSKYPPEGIPARPRSVDDWGTKFNITANMMAEGIERIHAAGGKVNLAYGGWYPEDPYDAQPGISADGSYEDIGTAYGLVDRILKNVADWNLDGVDFIFAGAQEGCVWSSYGGTSNCNRQGNNVFFHYAVIKQLRSLLPPTKTISYTTTHCVNFVSRIQKCEGEITSGSYSPSYPGFEATIMETVIAAAHPFLDKFSFNAASALDDENLDAMAALGIPLSKLGAVYFMPGAGAGDEGPTFNEMQAAVEKIKERKLAGLSLFSINQENNRFRGAFTRFVAELLYL